MKKIIFFLAATSIMACSSAKKQTELAQVPVAPKTAGQDESTKISNPQSDLVKREVCESGADKRTLEISKKSDGCDLSYEKFGKAKIVATGKFGTKHCQDSLLKITKKLEADNFKCQEI